MSPTAIFENPSLIKRYATANSKAKQETKSESTPPKATVVEPEPEEESKGEVRLSNLRFETEAEDLRFNEPFQAAVDFEIIQETKLRRVYVKLFAKYKGEEEDVSKSEAEFFFDEKTGTASGEITLYQSSKHAQDTEIKKGDVIEYYLEAEHKDGTEKVKSDPLEVSALGPLGVWFLEVPDITFNLNSVIPCIDIDAVLLKTFCAAYPFAEKNPEKELILFGHTDTSGEVSANQRISEYRGKAVKAILDFDESLWKEVTSDKGNVLDYQTILKTIFEAYGWDTDPGKLDGKDGQNTQGAVKGFQSAMNTGYGMDLVVDGKVGPNTWNAILVFYNKMMLAILEMESLPALKYGYKDGDGVYGCGESFPIEEQSPGEYISENNRRVEIVFVDEAQEVEIKPAPAPEEKSTKEDVPVFEEKKTERSQISTDPAEAEPPVNGEVVYLNDGNQVGILSPRELKMLKQFDRAMEKFGPHMKVYFQGGENNNSVKSVVILKLLQDFATLGYDDAEVMISNFDTIYNQEIDKAVSNLKAYKTGFYEAHKGFDGYPRELWWTSGKRMIRVPKSYLENSQNQKRNRWFKKGAVQRQLKKEFERDKQKQAEKTGPAKEGELKLLSTTFFNEQGSLGKDAEELNKKLKVDFFEGNRYIDSGVSAQLARYAYTGGAEVKCSWKENRELRAETKMSGSFALAQADGHFKISIPNEDGFDLLDKLRSYNKSFTKKQDQHLKLMLTLELTGSVFAGANAAVSGGAVIELNEDTSAGLEAGIEGFAGVKAEAKAKLSGQMMIYDDGTANSAKWEPFTEVEFSAAAAAGIGGALVFQLGYFDGKLKFRYKAEVVFKAGAGASIKAMVDAQKVVQLILTIAEAVNWEDLSDYLTDELYKKFLTLTYNLFVLGPRAINTIYTELMESGLDMVNEGFGVAKAIDDFGDEYIWGYSTFKKYDPRFVVLKSAKDLVKGICSERDQCKSAMAMVRKATQQGSWRFATWQTKVNLIYSMSRTGNWSVSGWSEEDKEDAVIVVLNNARSSQEFIKVVKALRNGDPGKREPVKFAKFLDDGFWGGEEQLAEFNKLCDRHGCPQYKEEG